MAYSTRKKRGRPPKLSTERRSDPCQRVIEMRDLFAFVVPTSGPEGRGGSIDQDICDGIGQLHALGYLDGQMIEAQDLRDKGREWRNHYVSLLKGSGFKTGSYERMDKARHEPRYSKRDEHFDAVDVELRGLERSALLQLLVDPLVGSYPDGRDNVWWAEAHICEGLLKRKKLPPRHMQPVYLPCPESMRWMDAAIRGLCVLASGQNMRRAA